MSCFMCSPAHITILAAYAVRNGYNPLYNDPFASEHEKLVMTYELLAKANAESVNERYRTGPRAEIGSLFEPALEVRPTPVQIIRMAQCFRYQSCECRRWKPGNVAHDLLAEIIDMAIERLPGYDQAPWSVADSDVANWPPKR